MTITRQKMTRKQQIATRQNAGHYLGVRCTIATQQPTLLPDLSMGGDHFDAIIQYDIEHDRFKVIKYVDHTLVVEGNRQSVIAKLIPCLPIVNDGGVIKHNLQELKYTDGMIMTAVNELEIGDQVLLTDTPINDGVYRVIKTAKPVADLDGKVFAVNFSGVIVQLLAEGGAYPYYHPSGLTLNLDPAYWAKLQEQGSVKAVFRYPLDWLGDDQPLPIGTRIKLVNGDQVFCLTDRGDQDRGLWINEDDSGDHVTLADDVIRRGDHIFQNMIFDNSDGSN